MPDIPLEDAIAMAVQHQQAGRLEVAEAIYVHVLQQVPKQAETLCLLGALHHQRGQTARGIELVRQSLAVNSNSEMAHSNLGVMQQALGQLEEARASFERAVALDPHFADAHYNLANVLRLEKDLAGAIAHTERAIALNPNDGRFHNNLGTDYAAKGEHARAVEAYRRALALNPGMREAWNNAGLSLHTLQRYSEAIQAFNQAAALDPRAADVLNNRGFTYHGLQRYHEAIADYQAALALDAGFAEAMVNLGNAYRAIGELDEAMSAYRRAAEVQPSYAAAHSNLLYLLYYHPASTAESIYAEHAAWGKTTSTTEDTENTEKRKNVVSVPSVVQSRRLRVGYVGADFHDHCQSFFTVPLFSNHDRARFEIFVYSGTDTADAITGRLRAHADTWREVKTLSDEQLAAQIRADGIDILVDLTMHMAGSRLRVFARKPAPVQITWLAYPGTTGLTQIDYRLTDPYLDPADAAVYTEKSLRLPHTFWCYDPLMAEIPVNALPALSAPHVTFGSLNTFCKVTAPTLQVWGDVLQAVPNSRMLILAPEGSARARVLAAMGVEPGRITFIHRQARRRYLETYQQIDLCLDTFPYNGHTTSLDAYWMGVPVVTRVGERAVSRAGLSHLTNLGLTELIARTPAEFVAIARRVAGDLRGLAELRATLRGRMQASPLMDGALFARGVEALYEKVARGEGGG